MTEDQKQELIALDTVKERATFLLGFNMSVVTTIVNLTPTAEASIGHVRLPCYGKSYKEASHRGTIYLKDKAEQPLTAEENSIL